MANMGSNGTVNISKSMMDSAVTAINDYQSAVKGLNGRLQAEMDGLIPANFSGSAAEGFKVFYTNKVLPNVEDNLTKMLDALKEICESIKSQIPGDDNGVDEQLGQGNQNPGSEN